MREFLSHWSIAGSNATMLQCAILFKNQQKIFRCPFNYVRHKLTCSTCEWWRAGPAAAPPRQRPSAAAGKALCGSWGGRCRSLAPPVTGTWDRRSWTALQTPAGLWDGEHNIHVITAAGHHSYWQCITCSGSRLMNHNNLMNHKIECNSTIT